MKRTGMVTAALGFILLAQIVRAQWMPAKRYRLPFPPTLSLI